MSDNDLKNLYQDFKEFSNKKLTKTTKKRQNYFYERFEKGYLQDPFNDAVEVARYFKEHGVETIINWSGSKGVHLRIPLNELNFEEDIINRNPKLFIQSLAESLEIQVLKKESHTSTIDYNVLSRNRGLIRLPCSKHEGSYLYSNFFNIEEEYSDAIKHILLEEPDYVPEVVNKDENTNKFLNLPIVKESIETATTRTDLYPNENENPHYQNNTEYTQLKNIIQSIYVPGCRNEIGYRIVHLLRRSEFTQEEVEKLFLDLHNGDKRDYQETIGGSIRIAYTKDIKQLAGLKHLIKGIDTLIKNQNKKVAIKYFKEHFNYYDKPSETITTPFILKDKEITVKILENTSDKWVLFESILEGIDLSINFNKYIGSFIRTKDDFEITSFPFKFTNKMFKVTKTDSQTVETFLDDDGHKLPKNLFNYLNQYFRNAESNVSEKKQLKPSAEIYSLFTKQKVNVRLARRKLGNFLKEKGMILRQGINLPYFLDKKSNGFNSVEIDDIVMGLDEKVFNHEDIVHSNDVEKALGFIADRRKPVYNIVKFPNYLYDMTNFKVIKSSDEPIFTLIEVKYNYNPKAKSEKVINFLKTSLKQEGDDEEKVESRVKGFLEMIGYILTSGNKLNAFFIIAGIGGAGKGVATNLITEIFGSDKVGGLQLQELTPDNRFATAHLESKQVNIVRDSPKKPIEETGMLKSITGYDDIPVEPKGKDKYMIPKEEVPDMILVCNNIPKFKDGIDGEIVQRIVMFEFLNRFRGTDNQNANLLDEILENDEEMEWLIYNGIEAYKNMIKENEDFEARIDENKTRDLLGKHTDPITYVLPKLVRTTDEDISMEEPVIAKELNKLIIYLITKKGMSVTDLDEHGHIKPRVLAEKIRTCFELEDWTTKQKHIDSKSETIYPNLYKTAEYNKLLEEMKNRGEENKKKNGI